MPKTEDTFGHALLLSWSLSRIFSFSLGSGRKSLNVPKTENTFWKRPAIMVVTFQDILVKSQFRKEIFGFAKS